MLSLVSLLRGGKKEVNEDEEELEKRAPLIAPISIDGTHAHLAFSIIDRDSIFFFFSSFRLNKMYL